MRIQFGSGENRLEGWCNLEIHNGDITKPLDFENESVDEILCEHCCEHVTGPDFFRFLIESKRILKLRGVLHLSMPVLDSLEADHAREIILGHGHLTAWTRDSLVRVCSLAGFIDMVEDTDVDGLRPAIYGHWKIIGEEKDEIESFRLRLIK